jgi:hypothetical protein
MIDLGSFFFDLLMLSLKNIKSGLLLVYLISITIFVENFDENFDDNDININSSSSDAVELQLSQRCPT